MGAVTYALTDTLALSDIQGLGRGHTVRDTLQFLDSALIAINPGLSLHVQDSINLTDILQAAMTAAKSVSDTLALSDGVETKRAYNFLGDTFSFTDAVATQLLSIFLAIAQTASDSLSFWDSVQFNWQGVIFLGDSLNLADSVKVNLRSVSTAYLRRYLNDV